MRIVILNASPKGDNSTTLNYVHRFLNFFSENRYILHNIGKDIKLIKHSFNLFNNILEDMENSDGIFIVSPVYFHLVPAQFKLFIEMLYDSKMVKRLKGKYITSITGSIHYYDNTAHNYLHAVCEDLGMNYFTGISFSLDEFDSNYGKENLIKFFIRSFGYFKTQPILPTSYKRITDKVNSFKIKLPYKNQIISNKRILLFTDTKENTSLYRMVDYFANASQNPVKVININKIKIRSGCYGCGNCLIKKECIIQDELACILKEEVYLSSAIVFGLEIKDRYFSALFKKFLDRWMVFGLSSFLENKQLAFILSGPYRSLSDIKNIIITYSESMGANLTGVVSNDYLDKIRIASMLSQLSENLTWSIDNNLQKPRTFIGVGGIKVEKDFKENYKNISKKYLKQEKGHKIIIKKYIHYFVHSIRNLRLPTILNFKKERYMSP